MCFACQFGQRLLWRRALCTEGPTPAQVCRERSWSEKEKALRVPRAVNIGWRFTARIQVVRQLGPGFFVFFEQKNDNSWKSVNSIDSGPIFYCRLGQKLSRNAFVVSILFPGRNLSWWKGPGHDRRKLKFSWIFEFSEKLPGSFQEASRDVLEVFWVSESVGDDSWISFRKKEFWRFQ